MPLGVDMAFTALFLVLVRGMCGWALTLFYLEVLARGFSLSVAILTYVLVPRGE